MSVRHAILTRFPRIKMSKPGDWICNSCRHLNFYWRQSCQRCQKLRPQGIIGSLGGQVPKAFPVSDPWVPSFRPGDWFCGIEICQAHNFSNRLSCFRCGAVKSVPSFGGAFGGDFIPLRRPLFPPMGLGFYGGGVGRIGGQEWRPGDWFCGRPECRAHNYNRRITCYKCNSAKYLVGNESN